MKTRTFFGLFFLLGFFLIAQSCGNKNGEDQKQDLQAQLPQVDETEALYQYVERAADLINSKIVPTMITADEVHENLGTYLIVDLRSPEAYAQGHIKGAKNVQLAQLLDFFLNSCYPSRYEKIALVCYSGQMASYATSLLRIAGYTNMYAMKRGMSAWNRQFAEQYWIKNATNKYADRLETKANLKGQEYEYPKIETGKQHAIEIVETRVQELLEKGFKAARVKNDEVFENTDKYYIINYWPESKYDQGHIPGAVQYTPKKSLSRLTYLNTLPTDKPIVVYCYTGQHSAFVVAYLRLLGYDAKSLLWGANGFMNNLMLSNEKIGHGFDPAKEVNNYEVVTGSEPGDVPETETTENADKSTNTPPPPPKKKKTEPVEGGC